MKELNISASRFRLILICSLFLIALAGTGIFWYTDDMLKNFAIEVNHTSVDASASRDDIQTLQRLQKELADNKDVVDKASSIVAESKSYQYQNQIIQDLNGYAAQAGITIVDMKFPDDTSGATTPQGSTSATQPGANTTKKIDGVKSVTADITLKNPVNYNSLLKFIQSIEMNLTKMQISKVSLSKDTNSSNVISDALTVQVYVR
jgi:hypothetical protein